MTGTEIANWTVIYAATGVCCTFAFILSIGTVAAEYTASAPGPRSSD